MTTKLLLRTATLTCALMMGFIARAQSEYYHVEMDYNPLGIVNPNVKFSCSYQQLNQMQLFEQAKSTVAKAEGNLCTVTFNLEYDPEIVNQPPRAYLIRGDKRTGASNNGEGSLVAQVEPGTYDIVAFFVQAFAQSFVIYEQYEVNGDVTLTLNPDQCTNHITSKCYGPDGELLKKGLGHFDENDEFVLDEEGNVYRMSATNILYLKGHGSIASFTVNSTGPETDEDKCTVHNDFYVTDVSDRFVFIQHRKAHPEDFSKSYYCWFSTDDVKAGVLENNPNEYVQQQFTYNYSPLGSAQEGYGIDIATWTSFNNLLDSRSSISMARKAEKPGDNFIHEVWANVPYIDPNIPEMGIIVQTGFTDYGETIIQHIGPYEIEQWMVTGWTNGPALRAKDGQMEITNVGHYDRNDTGNMQNNNLYYVNENGRLRSALSQHDAFTYPAQQALGFLGNNSPINAVKVLTYENDGQVNLQIQDYFVGLYGETLCGDKGVATRIKYNGEEVDLESFVPEVKGTYERTVTNTNVEVDGLPGHNTTTVYFDQNQEDMTPPAVEMLHFRSEEGVTDRFATAADGTMEFCASDFNYVYYPELRNGVFECQPVEVLVEYAPYGTEEWNELAVEEIPELFQEPGWGYFYRGSLAEVTGQGEKGWFDLRFRLQDASGNWMDQVVSPAFRIDDHAYSSVATIGSDNAREIARYNLAGQRVDADATGVVIIKMSDGTARKVLK